MRTLQDMTENETAHRAVRIILGDSIWTRSERIKAMAYVLLVGSDLQNEDINPILEMIIDLADDQIEHSKFASALLDAERDRATLAAAPPPPVAQKAKKAKVQS